MKLTVTSVLTALIIGGGTYYFTTNKANTDKAALQTTIDSLNKKLADLQNSAATTAADPTADWKTYANTDFNFSLKYPLTYTVTDTLQKGGNSINASQKLIIQDIKVAGSPMLEIFINPGGFDATPTNLLYDFSKSGTTLKINSKTKQNIAIGEFGYDGTVQIAGTNLGGQKFGNDTYVIRFHYNTGSESLLTTFDQILDSFRFTK
jgi:hypothetical protein